MRRLCAFLLPALVATAAAPAQAQDGTSAEADRRAARLEAHSGDFDYLLGSWRFTATSKDFGEFGGYWTAVRLATGAGSHVLDEYRVAGEDGETYFASTTLRTYNAVQDVWELVSTDAGTGLQDFGTARKVGDEMHIEQRFGVAGGKPELWRIFTWDFGDDMYAVVWRDNSAIHFVRDERRPSGVHLFQWVRDVDACYEEVVGRGAAVASEPVDRPYGIREFAVEDLNGVGIVFGQDIEQE